MLEESFYDSLDEGDCTERRTTKPKQQAHLKKRSRKSDEQIDNIPFYAGDKHKREICTKNPNTKKQMKKPTKIEKKSQSIYAKSYFELFCAKHPQLEESASSALSSRATCGDASPKSFTTCEDGSCCGNNSGSELSFYDDFIPYTNKPADMGSTQKLLSVSQQFVTAKVRQKKTKIPTKLPHMGGLGPEISKEKFELFKRRQLYGQKASQSNRIKFAENKVLKCLNEEIQLSNAISK